MLIFLTTETISEQPEMVGVKIPFLVLFEVEQPCIYLCLDSIRESESESESECACTPHVQRKKEPPPNYSLQPHTGSF
jgi:hypothetical protein